MNERLISTLNCDFDIQDLDVFLQAVEKTKEKEDKLSKRNLIYIVLFIISLFLWYIMLLSGHVSVSYCLMIPVIFFLMACIVVSLSSTEYSTVKKQYEQISAMINKIQELQVNPDIAKEDLAYVMKFDLDEQIFEITCFYKNESISDGHFLIPLDAVYFYEGNKIRIEGKFDDDIYIVNVYLPTENGENI